MVVSSVSWVLVVSVAIMAVNRQATGYQSDLCELANKFDGEEISKENITNMLCISYYKSKYNTENGGSSGETSFLGIFHIGDTWWCDKSPHGGCNISCSRLQDEDVKDDVKCAAFILKEEGLTAWGTWKKNCSISQQVRECFNPEDCGANSLNQHNTTETELEECTRTALQNLSD